eukprot:jgi/Botrbrau1/7854/Bobra.9_2s0030.1
MSKWLELNRHGIKFSILLVLLCGSLWQASAWGQSKKTKITFQGTLKATIKVNRTEKYWKEEAEALKLLEHFDSPEDELAPKGNIPPELAFQQRFHPNTGVHWAEKQELPLKRKWPKLPGDLLWRTTFSGCKEVKRAAWQRARKVADTCSIYILDASDVADNIGVPRCDVQNFAIDPRKSMILPNPRRLGYDMPEKDSRIQNANEMYPWSIGPHYYAQSGGPYFFYKSLLRSNIRTFDIDAADAVFVYDYCYMIWGLAESHATKHWWLKNIVNYEPNPNVNDVHRQDPRRNFGVNALQQELGQGLRSSGFLTQPCLRALTSTGASWLTNFSRNPGATQPEVLCSWPPLCTCAGDVHCTIPRSFWLCRKPPWK